MVASSKLGSREEKINFTPIDPFPTIFKLHLFSEQERYALECYFLTVFLIISLII